MPRLVREAGAVSGLARLRLSSIEINHVDEKLVSALRDTATVSRHLHVPLQSGDDGVLRAMQRRYDAATYLRRLEPLDDFNLTTDVIVGFPTEDEAAFARTIDVIERAGISGVHVFPYSPRPGTKTEHDDRVPPQVKRDRSAASAIVVARAFDRGGGGVRSGRPTRFWSTGRDADTATTIRRGSSTRRSASSCTCVRPR